MYKAALTSFIQFLIVFWKCCWEDRQGKKWGTLLANCLFQSVHVCVGFYITTRSISMPLKMHKCLHITTSRLHQVSNTLHRWQRNCHLHNQGSVASSVEFIICISF